MYFNYQRYGKPLIFSLLCFLCVYYLSASFFVALVVSSVPLLLGYMNTFANFGYFLTALIFLLAVVVVIIPDYVKSLISGNFSTIVERTKAEFRER